MAVPFGREPSVVDDSACEKLAVAGFKQVQEISGKLSVRIGSDYLKGARMSARSEFDSMRQAFIMSQVFGSDPGSL